LDDWGYLMAVVASIGIIAGSLAPWATSALESVSGTHGDGKYTVVGGIIALILVARRRLAALAVIIAILVVIDGISTISRVNDYTVSAFGQEVHPASTGWGLWLTVISGVALAIGGSHLRSEQQQKRIEEKVDRELDEEEAAASSQ
jgi:hypothetical protein